MLTEVIWAVANNLFHQGRVSEAELLLTDAFEASKKAGNVVADNPLLLLAQIRESQNRLSEAHSYCQQVLIFSRKRNPHMVLAVLHVAIRIQKKRGQYRKALAMTEEFKMINDSLQKVDKIKAIASLENRAELEKQTQRVALLKKNAAINQLEQVRTQQRQLLVGVLAFSLLLLAIGGGWAAQTARVRVNILQQQSQQIYKQALHLQELNSVKDKLFSVIGHDLRSPVLHLQVSLKQFNLSSIDPQRFDQQIAQLNSNVSSIFYALDNLLHWSARQRNRLVTRPVRVDLATLLQQVLLLFEPMITQKALDVKLDEGPLWAWVDEIQAQIILRNIIDNACKFTPVGGQIRIDYQAIGAESVVRVVDTGVGMETTKEYQSPQRTGLGLVVTKEFLELNGGRLFITSQSGEGTTVQLFFRQTTADDSLSHHPA